MKREALDILHRGTVIPATPLALDENRQFDEARQRLLTRYYLEAGAGGIATAVHSTQFEIRDPEVNLFETVLKTVASEIAAYEAETGKTVVRIAGVCGKIEQAVAAEMPVIGFYLQPSVGGRVFSYTYWEQICEIPNVVAIKCAPFNRYLTQDVVRACAFSSRSDEIALYTGNDDNIVVDLLTEYAFTKDGKTITKRFAGGLLGHWCVWTHAVAELFPRLQNQKATPELLTLAAEITDANGVIFDAAHNFAGCIPGIHEILHRQGLLKGIWCLNPKEVLSEGQAEEIDRICRMYPHLTDDYFVKEFLKRHESL